MRQAKLTVAVVMLAALTGCEGLGFAEGGAPGVKGTGGEDAAGDGGGAGDSTASVGSGGYASPAAELEASDQSSAGLCSTEWPTITETPRALSGYASAQYARHLLLGSPRRLPEPELLRADDFLAYYGDRTKSSDDREVDLHFVASSDDPAEGYVEVRVRRSGPTTGMHFVILADVSPSMVGALDLERKVLGEISGALTAPGDVASLVSFAGGANTLLVQGNGDALATAVGQLSIGGGNDLEGALKTALVLAEAGGPAELILLTDGGLELTEPIVTALAQARAGGVRSSVVQLAKSDRQVDTTILHDAFLNGFASAGGGASLFIASTTEAELAFGERFDEGFRRAFSDVTVSVQLPGGFVSLEPAGDDPSSTAAPGGSLGYDRWHRERHRVSVCTETKDAAANLSGQSDVLQIAVQVSEGGVAVGAPIEVAYDNDFTSPSVGAQVDDLVLATVQYLRAPDAAAAPTPELVLAKQAAGCPSENDKTCATLDDLLDLVAAAETLRGE